MGQAMHCKLLPSFTSSNMQQRLIPNPVFEFLGEKKKNYFLLLNLVFAQTALVRN